LQLQTNKRTECIHNQPNQKNNQPNQKNNRPNQKNNRPNNQLKSQKKQTERKKTSKSDKQRAHSNEVTVSKQSRDISWSPDVPPGHTRYSWEQKKSTTIITKDDKKEKPLTISVHQIMNKFKLSRDETKHGKKSTKPCSQHLLVEGSDLRWNKKKGEELTKEEIEKVCEVVEYSILNQGNQITQGVHDRYVKFCVQQKRKLLFFEDHKWHKSKYLQLKSNLLELNQAMWAEEKIKSIADLAENDAVEFIEEVEHCIFERFSVSKKVDSMYLTYCATQNHQEMAHYTGQEAYEHGYRLLHGIMVPIDKQTGMHYIQQAVEFDQYPAAHSLLGYCYQFGDGVRIDVERSIEHYQTAVDNDDAFGKVRLGRCYFLGIGVPKDKKKAQELFEDGLKGLRSIADSKRPDSNRALCLLHTQPAEH